MESLLKWMIITLTLLPVVSANTYLSDEPGCQIIGDVDVYGIGIRLGYYLQFASAAIFIFAERADDVRGVRNGFNAFGIALLVNLFRNASTTLIIEWYLVFLLVVAIPSSIFMATYRTSFESSKEATDTFNSLVIQCLLQFTFAIGTVWLFFTNAKAGQKEGCEVTLFFFRDIHVLHGNWIRAGKGLAIFFVLYIPTTYAPSTYIFTKLPHTLKRQHRESSTGSHIDNFGYWNISRRVVRKVVSGIALSMGVVAVAFLEKTIGDNVLDMRAGPITGAGQLIPFVIGVYVLLYTVFYPVINKVYIFIDRKFVAEKREGSERRQSAGLSSVSDLESGHSSSLEDPGGESVRLEDMDSPTRRRYLFGPSVVSVRQEVAEVHSGTQGQGRPLFRRKSI